MSELAITRNIRKRRELTRTVFGYAALIVFGILFLMPFFWYISTAFKPPTQVYSIPPKWIPTPPTFDNFVKGWQTLPFNIYMLNTLFLTAMATIGTLASSSLVAYGFARFRAKGKMVIFTILLSTMMLPAQITLIPTYMIYNWLRWLDTFLPLIVPTFLGTGAFYIFLLRQFFVSIPRELDEAAKIEGCGSFRVFISIILPLSKTALTTVFLFTIINVWNDFMNQLIYLSSDKNYTIAVGLQFFNSKYGPQQVNLLMAVSFATILPLLILFFLGQRYFVKGIVMTGIKG